MLLLFFINSSKDLSKWTPFCIFSERSFSFYRTAGSLASKIYQIIPRILIGCTGFIDKLIDIFILAIIQGVTEWLPVSSSGHLVIAQEYLGLKLPLIFDVALHAGTLGVVLAMFRRDLTKIFKALFRLDFRAKEGKLALFIAVGSVPTALTGFLFRDALESLFYNPLAVGIALLTTGLFLYASKSRRSDKELDYLDSLLIGVAQGIAIIPGVSRSGVTIAVALLRGVRKETAFTYSFLLSIPAVIGATITESRGLAVGGMDVVAVLFGALVSMIVGYVSLKLLLRIVMKGRLHLFAYYCWIVGAIIIVFSLFRLL
jgi:undecaprenyl-diphosphatase